MALYLSNYLYCNDATEYLEYFLQKIKKFVFTISIINIAIYLKLNFYQIFAICERLH